MRKKNIFKVVWSTLGRFPPYSCYFRCKGIKEEVLKVTWSEVTHILGWLSSWVLWLQLITIQNIKGRSLQTDFRVIAWVQNSSNRCQSVGVHAVIWHEAVVLFLQLEPFFWNCLLVFSVIWSHWSKAPLFCFIISCHYLFQFLMKIILFSK